MKVFLCLSITLVSLLPAAHIDLFVLTGQSNSLGTTAGGEADVSPGVDPADAQVKFFWSNRATSSVVIGDSGGVFSTLQSQQGGYYSGSTTHWGPEVAEMSSLCQPGFGSGRVATLAPPGHRKRCFVGTSLFAS